MGRIRLFLTYQRMSLRALFRLRKPPALLTFDAEPEHITPNWDPEATNPGRPAHKRVA